MDLFTFASRSERNIRIGVEQRMWAVSTIPNIHNMAARVTRAERHFHVGARGLLYCNPRHAFTTPFVVRSKADPEAKVSDIWPSEIWRLPFKIEPLGNLSRQLPADEAKKRWPFLQQRLRETRNRGGVSAALRFTGLAIFTPVEITADDWAIILSDLAIK